MSAPIAVVDLGTNSTRLLVATVTDGRVEQLERRSTVTRLGEGVDASGTLSEAAMKRVFDTLDGYRELIDRHGAERVVAVATSAVRDSSNGQEFRRELRERFGIDAQILTGDQEARLTFLGATATRPADASHHAASAPVIRHRGALAASPIRRPLVQVPREVGTLAA